MSAGSSYDVVRISDLALHDIFTLYRLSSLFGLVVTQNYLYDTLITIKLLEINGLLEPINDKKLPSISIMFDKVPTRQTNN